MRSVDELDLRIRAVMHVQYVLVAAACPIQSRELVAVMKHADVAHVDEYARFREATARAFGVLLVTGVEITRLQLANRLDRLEAFQAFDQALDGCLRGTHAEFLRLGA